MRKRNQGLTRTFLLHAFLLCSHHLWGFCCQTGLLWCQSGPGNEQNKPAKLRRGLLIPNWKAPVLNAHVLFLSTIFFTLIARCSEYSLHTPSKTSTHTWLLAWWRVANGHINELTFQIHFNEVKNCDSVLFNLGQHQLLLCYRDNNTHCRTHTYTHRHTRYDRKLVQDGRTFVT